MLSRIAMRLSSHADVWVEGYGKCGVGITGEAWLRPRWTVSNDWARGSCPEPLNAKWMSCISVQRY